MVDLGFKKNFLIRKSLYNNVSYSYGPGPGDFGTFKKVVYLNLSKGN